MQQSLDFTKLYCQLHPYELVTNYCNDQKCLVGLCATCICSHTEMHAQLGTVPQFQNIRDTFCCLHDEARNQISLLQEDKNKLGSLRQSIQVKKITIKKTIRQIRQDALNKIKQEFDALQKKILTDVCGQQKKQGYHSSIRFETLSKNLSRQTDTLLSYIEGLNSPSFLQWTRKLKRDALHQSNESRLRIEREISENQTYTANLKWKQNFMQDLTNTIRKMFTLEFVIPKQTGEVKSCIAVLRPSNINMINSRASSQPKLSQTFTKNNSLIGLSKFIDTSHSSFFNDQTEKCSTPLHKQSFIRKNVSMISELTDSQMLGTKQNCMTQSSYIPDSIPVQFINRSSIINNPILIKSGFQTQKLANLIDMKRSNQFQSARTSTMGRELQVGRQSLMKLY